VQQLIGYVVPSNGGIDEETLRSNLRARLPAYMVPALIETVTDLPQLPSGKLDRASLPPPRARESTSKPAARQPRTETERRIAQVFGENLVGSQPTLGPGWVNVERPRPAARGTNDVEARKDRASST